MQCDVCRAHRKGMYKHNIEDAQKAIIKLLEDKKPHHITEIRNIKMPSEIIDEALLTLVNEEVIHVEGSRVSL